MCDWEDEFDNLEACEVLGGEPLGRAAAAAAAEAVDGVVGGNETSVSGDEDASKEKDETNVGMAALVGEEAT
jgi:hypothetical protein